MPVGGAIIKFDKLESLMNISMYVNLHSYSSPKGFLGYVEYIGENTRSGTDGALDKLDRFLCLVGEESTVFTTLALKAIKEN